MRGGRRRRREVTPVSAGMRFENCGGTVRVGHGGKVFYDLNSYIVNELGAILEEREVDRMSEKELGEEGVTPEGEGTPVEEGIGGIEGTEGVDGEGTPEEEGTPGGTEEGTSEEEGTPEEGGTSSNNTPEKGKHKKETRGMSEKEVAEHDYGRWHLGVRCLVMLAGIVIAGGWLWMVFGEKVEWGSGFEENLVLGCVVGVLVLDGLVPALVGALNRGYRVALVYEVVSLVVKWVLSLGGGAGEGVPAEFVGLLGSMSVGYLVVFLGLVSLRRDGVWVPKFEKKKVNKVSGGKKSPAEVGERD